MRRAADHGWAGQLYRSRPARRSAGAEADEARASRRGAGRQLPWKATITRRSAASANGMTRATSLRGQGEQRSGQPEHFVGGRSRAVAGPSASSRDENSKRPLRDTNGDKTAIDGLWALEVGNSGNNGRGTSCTSLPARTTSERVFGKIT